MYTTIEYKTLHKHWLGHYLRQACGIVCLHYMIVSVIQERIISCPNGYILTSVSLSPVNVNIRFISCLCIYKSHQDADNIRQCVSHVRNLVA